MKKIYDRLSEKVSTHVMYEYSTSFYLSTFLLSKKNRRAIYSVYGFVRLADEIVDSFHKYNKSELLDEFENEFNKSIKTRISLNPIINSFQKVYHKYKIDYDLVKSFIDSMRLDLNNKTYNKKLFNKYIYGSAEVVGLMCLKIFVNGNNKEYEKLKHSSISLGAAFQKVNFLRDLHYDTEILNRRYFNMEANKKSINSKKEEIILDIKKDFKNALPGIKKLNKGAQIGVYTSYLIYLELLKKIEKANSVQLLTKRTSVLRIKKLYLLLKSFLVVSTNLKKNVT
ncbi:MAG: phytoene synthase [Candidatus Marinimicrobia bacterium]|nr:phytoene synthase [Candidatus Neomarinimicrobiota bacterium]|tara:strand:+ start:3153 stop:4001 length:849 start_codon:yes stop_codon:yes gene_type:complete